MKKKKKQLTLLLLAVIGIPAFLMCVIFGGLVLLVTITIPHQMIGNSMDPALGDGEFVLGKEVSLDQIERGDIIVYRSKRGVDFVHRVVGLPGDKLEIKEGILYINGGRESKEHFEKSHSLFGDDFIGKDCGGDMAVTVVPEGYVFVMGDNRKNSMDSRFLGPVKESAISDRIFLCYWNCR
ncbi:signal peptidase I [Candidatus Dojkabacteria bacterium]|nr:signal peptidase I [Candidatus Dojkabacteria bacterium]